MTLNKRMPAFEDMPSFNYRDMRAALEVSEQGSVTKAAENLGMSQPGLTRMVQRLERGLGFKLFKRGSKKRSMTITDRGMYALVHMDHATTQIHHLMTEEPA